MRVKKLFCMVLTCMLLVGTMNVPTRAVEMDAIVPCATGQLNLSIAPKTKVSADTSFPMAAGETVTIKASYTPFSASVDFGLVDSDGYFHYINVTNGSINKTIRIEETGNYTLRIRNNSDSTVNVSGCVNY